MNSLRREREIKVAVADLGRVRIRLQAAGATLVHAASRESNLVFDRRSVADGDLLRTRRELLRLRTDDAGSRVAWKGRPVVRDGVKERSEYEFAVDDPEAARLLLEALGFVVSTRYEKVRERWRLGGCEIAVDDTPAGAFVEVEQVDADLPDGCIEAVCRRFGIDPERADPRDYLAIYRDLRSRLPDLPPDMVFLEPKQPGGGSGGDSG